MRSPFPSLLGDGRDRGILVRNGPASVDRSRFLVKSGEDLRFTSDLIASGLQWQSNCPERLPFDTTLWLRRDLLRGPQPRFRTLNQDCSALVHYLDLRPCGIDAVLPSRLFVRHLSPEGT